MPTILTDSLNIFYLDTGPITGIPVLLLHGWPDDETTWSDVSQRLNRAGFRTIMPTLRGFGRTTFVRTDTRRTGDSGILALDAITLMDALKIKRFCVAGHDWGARISEALAVGWPARVQSMVMMSTPPRAGGVSTPSFEQAQRQWYHWFQATKRGAQAVRDQPKAFARFMWTNWSPPGWFEESTFERVARSFENPDWVDVTLHSYRARWDEVDPDVESRWLEDKIKRTTQLTLPAMYIQGEADGVNPPRTTENIAAKFSGSFQRFVLPGVGHFPTREAPEDVSELLIKHFAKWSAV
ncbi:MAG TPA: alpha/beta hydrolase [Afipia sp.]